MCPKGNWWWQVWLKPIEYRFSSQGTTMELPPYWQLSPKVAKQSLRPQRSFTSADWLLKVELLARSLAWEIPEIFAGFTMERRVSRSLPQCPSPKHFFFCKNTPDH